MVGYQDSTTIDEAITTSSLTVLDTKREFHNDEASAYWLPKDDEEQMRLTGVRSSSVIYRETLLNIFVQQHFAIKDLYGG
jgi:hypothetical protein